MTATMEPGSITRLTGDTRSAARTPVERFLAELHDRYRDLQDGTLADYIPELSKADPAWFGISVVTLDGHVNSVGDSDVPFTIQSISKPFVYGLALEDNGEDYVISKVGLEPSGDAFNAISLDPATGVPSNPMINAGAIASTGMVRDTGPGAATRILEMFGAYTGRHVEVDEAVYRSESATGHRNRAIGHLLRNFEIVDGDPEDALDLYFRTCAISVTCRDLAVAAACLANGGVNPITGERAVDTRYVSSILSVMGSCGMYDYAGEWIYRVGMPAKSGVSGGVLAVLPGQLGIGVFSPLLDDRGNSVRGVRVCVDVSRSYGLHMLKVPNLGGSSVRATYDLNSVRSKRQRAPGAMEKLAAAGSSVRIYELQGDIIFASAEAFSRRVIGEIGQFDMLAVDLKHVTRLGTDACAILSALLRELLEAGKSIALSGPLRTIECIAVAGHSRGTGELSVFADRDHALEWCEERVLERAGYRSEAEAVSLAENELLAGLDDRQVELLEAVGRSGRYAEGDVIVRAGDSGGSLYLILSGEVSVTIDTVGEDVRVATLSSGMSFGEMSLLGENSRSANVTADGAVECFELPVRAVAALSETDPGLGANLYRNLSGKLAANLRRANAEIRALSG